MREMKQGGPPLGPYTRLTGPFAISSLWVLFICVYVCAAMAQAGTLTSFSEANPATIVTLA